jgi:diguanylate cyclase (GGDEF)-like protein
LGLVALPRRGVAARVAGVVTPVCVAGAAAVGMAALSFANAGHGAATLGELLAVLTVSALAQRFPVPVDGLDTRGVDVGFVFGVATVVLFGWEAGVLVASLSQVVAGTWERNPPIRIAFNASTYGLGALAAGLLIAPVSGDATGTVVLEVAVCAIVQFSVNVALITAVVSASRGDAYGPLLLENVMRTAVAFALMGATSLILVVLWQREPSLALALLGPLFAIALYQRSQHRALTAMRLALTDPLTDLGNHRSFHERLKAEVRFRAERGEPVTLCLLDVDDFKTVNDRFGHPVGDRLLAEVAARLRQDGEAFRLGGDEFGILLAGRDEAAGLEAAHSISRRIADIDLGRIRPRVSIGVATLPNHAGDRHELVREADRALYRAKAAGKNTVRSAGRPSPARRLARVAAGAR